MCKSSGCGGGSDSHSETAEGAVETDVDGRRSLWSERVQLSTVGMGLCAHQDEVCPPDFDIDACVVRNTVCCLVVAFETSDIVVHRGDKRRHLSAEYGVTGSQGCCSFELLECDCARAIH